MSIIIKRLCWWFSYDITKNMTKQIILNFSHNLVRPVRPFKKSLYLEVIWTMKNRVMGLKSWRVFFYVVCENRQVGILVYQPESAELLQNGVIYNVVKNLVKKFIDINLLMISLQTKNSIFLVCSDIIKI